MSNPHKNYRSDWQTSPAWAAWVRETMGAIDLDPASSRAANMVIGASEFYSRGGVMKPWNGRIYCNPPGSNSTASVRSWWAHAMAQFRQRSTIRSLVWCWFNSEAAFKVRPSPWELHGFMTLPRKRVKFWRDGREFPQPRNFAVWWSTARPAKPPEDSIIIRTGGFAPVDLREQAAILGG